MNTLGERMKMYESVSKSSLVRRMPVIIRLDGCHFHTFTRGFDKPFDEVLTKTMKETMLYLCQNIQGCVLGYTQSDEITLVLCDYKTLNTNAWFDNEVQKMCSVSASMASMIFNEKFEENSFSYMFESNKNSERYDKVCDAHLKAINKGAYFDARVFNIPKEEVTNCILWRQNDATRNSIQALGQSKFSHKQLQGKSCNEIQDMLFTEHQINWNNLQTSLKRGCCCVRDDNDKWIIDDEIPIFTGDGRDYIEKLINFE